MGVIDDNRREVWRSSSRTRIRARSSALLLELGFVPFAVGSGCTLARSGIIGL